MSRPMQFRLEQLVVSTAKRSPRTAGEATWSLVATTNNVPARVRDDFVDRADVAGSLLRRHFDPVFMFVRSADDFWIFGRIVTVGTYRGGQQPMIHGLMLPGELVAGLQGNPFLLTRSDCGELFSTDYPATRELSPAPVDAALIDHAGELNRERFRELSDRFADDAAWFPAIYHGLVRGRRVAWLVERPETHVEALEWILLHFHPHDRANVGFHTWYAHSHRLQYDLIAAVPEDAGSIARQFDKLVFVGDRTHASEEASDLARIVIDRRNESAVELLDTIEEYGIRLRSSAESQRMSPEAARLLLSRPGQLRRGELVSRQRALLESDSDRAAHEYFKTHLPNVALFYERRFQELDDALQVFVDEARHHSEPQRLVRCVGSFVDAQRAEDQPVDPVTLWILVLVVDRLSTTTSATEATLGRLLSNGALTTILGRCGAASQPDFDRYICPALVRQCLQASANAETPQFWPDCLEWIGKRFGGNRIPMREVEQYILAESPAPARWLSRLIGILNAHGRERSALYLRYLRLIPSAPAPTLAGEIRAGLTSLFRSNNTQYLKQLLQAPRTSLPALEALVEWLQTLPGRRFRSRAIKVVAQDTLGEPTVGSLIVRLVLRERTPETMKQSLRDALDVHASEHRASYHRRYIRDIAGALVNWIDGTVHAEDVRYWLLTVRHYAALLSSPLYFLERLDAKAVLAPFSHGLAWARFVPGGICYHDITLGAVRRLIKSGAIEGAPADWSDRIWHRSSAGQQTNGRPGIVEEETRVWTSARNELAASMLESSR